MVAAGLHERYFNTQLRDPLRHPADAISLTPTVGKRLLKVTANVIPFDNNFYEFCIVQVAHKSCKSHKKNGHNAPFYKRTSIGIFHVSQPANETGGSNSKTGVALRQDEAEA